MKYYISTSKPLIESIKDFPRIKKLGAVQNIFTDLNPLFTQENCEKCYYMLIKKTTYKHLKAHFAGLLLKHFDASGFTYNDKLSTHFIQLDILNKTIKRKKNPFARRFKIQGSGPKMSSSKRLKTGFGLSAPMRD